MAPGENRSEMERNQQRIAAVTDKVLIAFSGQEEDKIEFHPL